MSLPLFARTVDPQTGDWHIIMVRYDPARQLCTLPTAPDRGDIQIRLRTEHFILADSTFVPAGHTSIDSRVFVRGTVTSAMHPAVAHAKAFFRRHTTSAFGTWCVGEDIPGPRVYPTQPEPCPICTHVDTHARRALPCGHHQTHEDCLLRWKKTRNGVLTCPLCRADASVFTRPK